MTSKRYAKILRGAGINEIAVETNILMAQFTGTPYSEGFAAQAETLRDYYTLSHTPLPKELRRWEAERA